MHPTNRPATLHTIRREAFRAEPELFRELHTLKTRHNLRLAQFGALWTVGTGLAAAHVFLAYTWILLVPAVAFCAVGTLGLAILIHEFAHGLFSRNRTLNALLGTLSGLLVLVSAATFRRKHLHHHATVGTDRDTTDVVAGARKLGVPVPLVVLWVLFFGTTFVLVSLAVGGWRLANPRQRRTILAEWSAIALLHGTAWTVAPTLWFWVWLVPFVLASFLHNVRALAEHTLTERDDPVRNARTTPETGFVAWLHSNAGFHWEHHVFPGVPWYNLPRLHTALEPWRTDVPVSPGYAHFVWTLLLFVAAPASWYDASRPVREVIPE
jgi:fatty acid desaturase